MDAIRRLLVTDLRCLFGFHEIRMRCIYDYPVENDCGCEACFDGRDDEHIGDRLYCGRDYCRWEKTSWDW